MDASVQPATSVFLQLFQAHCSHSDLGQINVNWFEDLSREAARIPPSLQEEVRSGGRRDDNLFKTPQQKHCHYSQLESTPAIFKEQSLFFPLFLSPKKDDDKRRSAAGNFRNVDKTQQSPDNSVSASEVFATSSRYLSGSPAFPKQLYKTPVQDRKYLQRTPQQDRQFDIFGSLLSTPQMIWNQSSRCISESLGVEADPEMSWTSSLATPPSPTLIIAQPPEEVSKPMKFDRDDVVIVRSLFTKMNSVADASLAPPSGTKIDSDGTKFGKNTDTAMFQHMGTSSDYLKIQQRRTILNAIGEEAESQVVENTIEGIEDVLPIFSTSKKPPEFRKVKVDRQIQRKDEPLSGGTGKNDLLTDSENHIVNGKLPQQKTCSRELASSYEWTQLSLPDAPQEGSIAIEIGSCGDGITKKNSMGTDSQLHRNGTAASETNKIHQDDLLSTFQYEEHNAKSDEGLPCDAVGDNKPLLGLVSSHHSSSFAVDDKPWKNISISNQKPKSILSTMKKQTKFLYSLKIDCQQTETTEKIDMTLCRSSHGTEKPDDQSTKSLDLKNAAPAYNLSEVKEVVIEEDDDFKLNSIDFQEIEESCMNMMQTGPADSTASSGGKSNVNRTTVTSVGGDSVELKGAKSECISQVFDGQALVSDRNTKIRTLDSVTDVHSRVDNSQENHFISGNNCDSTHTTTHPEEAESKPVIETCSDLLAEANMQSVGGFKTSSNKKIYIAEENLRKGEDEALTISCPTKIENGNKTPELNEENKTPITSSMCQQPDLESSLKRDTGIESLNENSVEVLNATPTKMSKKNLQDLSSGMESHLYDSFTESQKAEIIELSSIFESAGSQFDFTQVNKLNILASGKENLQNAKSISDFQKLNISDTWKDVDFSDSCGTGEENIANVCSIASESESKGDTGTNICDLADNKSVLYSCIKPSHGFTLASGKSVNITDEDLIKAMEMFTDLEEKSEEINAKPMQDLNCLSNSKTFSVLHNTTNSRSGTLPGNDGLNSIQTTAISSHALSKDKCLSDVGTANRQDYTCKSDDKCITKLQPTEMESSKRSFPFTSVQNQDRASSNFENRTSTSCLPIMPVGFATGKGKIININKTSFDKARTIFNDILETDLYDEHCRTHTTHEPSSLLVETDARSATSTFAGKERHRPTFGQCPVRFSKEHIVPSVTNDDTLKKTKQIGQVLRKEVTKESSLPQPNNPMSNMSLFSTACGKPIQLSEEGLKRAHKMFSEIDDGYVGEQPTTGIAPKESTVNSSSLYDLNHKSVHVKEATFNIPQPGFSTAKGIIIEVSEKCLQKAREIYADIEGPNVLDVGQRNLSSRRKSEVSNQEKNNVCDASESLNHSVNTDVTQVRIDKPLVNQITTGPSAEVSAEITPLDNVSKKEMFNKTFSCKDEIPNLNRISFSTAAGKPYQLSEDSLKKAHAMFADLDDSLLPDQEKPGSSNHQSPRRNPKTSLPSLGFSRASGKTIAVSESSLQKARQTFEDTCDTVRDTGYTMQGNATVFARPTIVFKTASEKTVTVSDESLQKAKLLFAVTDDPQDTAKNSDGKTAIKITQNEESGDFSPVGFCQTNKCSITGKANKSYSSEGNKSKSDTREPVLEGGSLPKMPCFHTAGGKSVTVSEESLKRAQEIFSEVDNGCSSQNDAVVDIQPNPKSTSHAKLAVSLGFSRESGKTIAVSASSLQKAGQMFADTCDTVPDTGHNMQVNATVFARPTIVFKTASEKTVTVSDESLQKAKLLFAVSDDPLDTAKNSDGNKSKSDAREPVAEGGSSPKMPCFYTAGGKSVTVSEESLKRAQEIFSEVDNGCSSQNDSVDIQPSPKSTSSAKLVLREKSLVHEPSEKKSPNLPTKTSFGFSTASGKQVSVSEEALQKVKDFFEEGNTNENLTGNLNENQESIRKNTFNPLPNKRSFKDSVAKLDYLQKNTMEGNEGNQKISTRSYDFPPRFVKDSKPLHSAGSTNLPSVSSHNPENDFEFEAAKGAKAFMDDYQMTKPSFGFSTASGKQVSVSEEALHKVKGFFEEGNTNENLKDNFNENQESIRMNTFNPLPSKQPFKDSVAKLDYLQKNTMEGNEGNQKISTRSYDFPPRFVKHSTPLHGAGATNLSSVSSHNSENDFEFKAAKGAKDFMDDDQTNCLFPSSTKLPNIGNDKRLRSDDGLSYGEPPFKRQLLPEFDRSLMYDSALKPLTSSPHESLKDRRKYFCNASLQPLSSDPASFSKGKPNTPEPGHPAASRHSTVTVSRNSVPTTSTHVPADGRNDPNKTAKKGTSSFVIPFKKKAHMSMGEHTVTVPRQDQDNAKDINESRIAIGTAQRDESVFCSGPDFSDLVPSICCARDMQEMRIRKKQRQKIKPQPGSLYQQKSSSSDRINLVTAVKGRQPTVYTQTELYRFGVLKNHIGINSETAEAFRFHCLDYFTRECFVSEGEVQIADGGWLVPADTLTAGREEFYRALCDTPGVDPKLISPEWVYNHYRWIVWKLAAMEVMFPMVFASRCLTPERVLLQLKYRYDVEIDKYRRSAVRKIMERDDTPAKTLVLCICRILTLGNHESSDTKQSSAVIEVTDGWYGIKALLDPALTCLLNGGRMFIGQKIIVHGAELVGSDDACAPLEAPEALMLKIAGNSTRPARWYTKLGYFQDPRPFCLRLSSLLADGGIVGCVDVLIQRIYPIQWMEKMGNGTYVFRNERAEEREAERHCMRQQKSLEVLFVKIQEQYEKQQVCSVKRRPRRQSLSEAQIRALQDGAELYEALQTESDPGYLESCLSNDQLRALNHHRQSLNDKRHAEIQAQFRKAMESSEQEAGSGARRDVTPVWKMRIVDYKDPDSASAYTLNIWRPLPDVVSLLKEGGRFKIYQLAASQSKGKCDPGAVQLTATKKTQFQQLQPLQHALQQIYSERRVTELSQFLEPHFTADYGEVDVVGLVISTQQKPGAAPLVYLSDETCNFMAMKFYTDLGQLALEELTKPCSFIAAANLRWRLEYISGVPLVFAREMSIIAANPKEHHLQKAIQKLRQSIQSVPEFCKDIENKLMNLLQAQNPQERASFMELRSHVAAGSKCSINTPKMMKQMATPDRSNTVFTDPNTCKKMKGLDYLGRIPSPAPLTPIGTLPSPSLQRAFRPPRSLHKEDRPCTKTSLNTDPCTPNKLEEGFVTDEELAMIDTQALVSGLEGGSKRAPQQEAADTQKKSPNLNRPASDEAQTTQEVGPAPYQGRLCRKRKLKP